MPQFNMRRTAERWYTLTYQSNNLLNIQLHHQTKELIANIIVDTVRPTDIHSYIHGHMIFSVNTTRPVTTLTRIIEALQGPLAAHTPRLFFSVALVAHNSEDLTNYMYVEGSTEMDDHFRESIRHFYP